MNIDYATIEQDIQDGSFRTKLQEELETGFHQIHATGERLPVPSHYASQIAEIVNREVALTPALQYELYQEILLACEQARAAVLAEPS